MINAEKIKNRQFSTNMKNFQRELESFEDLEESGFKVDNFKQKIKIKSYGKDRRFNSRNRRDN